MSETVYDIKSIISIDNHFLTFRNENTICKIDLKECALNYAKWFNNNTHLFLGVDGIGARKIVPEENKCVARREYPFFVFFTGEESREKFQMLIPKMKWFNRIFKAAFQSKCFREFWKIQTMLIEAGWHSYDCS